MQSRLPVADADFSLLQFYAKDRQVMRSFSSAVHELSKLLATVKHGYLLLDAGAD